MILKTICDCLSKINEKFPDAKLVPVCMGDVVHNVYEDSKYQNQVAQILYCESNTGLWGYDYNLKFTK